MLFNSFEFVLFFVVIITTIVIIKNKKFQHLFLLGSSYFFFYFSSNYLLSLLIISTILDFYLAKKIWTADHKSRKVLLSISLAGNLGLLGFFKYADFAILQFNILGNYINLNESIPFLNLALPIGISFYTFQTISYTVDVYRKKLKPSDSFSEFALFVSFFPQLVAGPIIRASNFLPQLREKLDNFDGKQKLRWIVIENKNLKTGITLMALGFFKKMFFADNIAPIVNEVFTNPIGLSSLEIWLGTIAFGIQIYCDFSGYSDIAIGAALVLGFKIPMNFNKPYFATSPTDFWRRWHISLSTWLRDYLYIPLGGNRSSKYRTAFNLFVVMFLGGLWHGASWNFVIWGILHGFYLGIHKMLVNKFPKIANSYFFKTKLGKIFTISITQFLIFFTWIPFRVKDAEGMIYAMQKFVSIDFELSGITDLILQNKFEVSIMILFILIHSFSYYRGNLIESLAKLSLKKWTLVLTLISLTIVFFFNGNPEDFIYFKF